MKKKKLKKKIKKLEKEVERYRNNLSVITRTDISLTSKIRNLNDKIAKLENDNKYYKEWMDRSGVDYKSWFNFEEKTCDTCRWKPLYDQGGQDIPCIGCTADDKKMWKSKY